jgi:hypothetical protein
METFVGLDVSLKETSVCILNQKGALVFEGKVASEPAAITRLIGKHAPNDHRQFGSIGGISPLPSTSRKPGTDVLGTADGEGLRIRCPGIRPCCASA